MRSWDISTLDVPIHNPAVLDSEDEGRAIVIQLPAGGRLQEHQVHERAWLLVVSGAIEIDGAGRRRRQRRAGNAGGVRPQRAPRGPGDRGRTPAAAALPLARPGHPSQR